MHVVVVLLVFETNGWNFHITYCFPVLLKKMKILPGNSITNLFDLKRGKLEGESSVKERRLARILVH